MSTLLFPGQGSQIVGMGLNFLIILILLKKYSIKQTTNLNFKLSKIILKASDSDLKLTKNTQPAILTVSYSIFKVLKDEFNFDLKSFKFFAGHSLGEYSALVCALDLPI